VVVTAGLVVRDPIVAAQREQRARIQDGRRFGLVVHEPPPALLGGGRIVRGQHLIGA
jgi:hypothetical protein